MWGDLGEKMIVLSAESDQHMKVGDDDDRDNDDEILESDQHMKDGASPSLNCTLSLTTHWIVYFWMREDLPVQCAWGLVFLQSMKDMKQGTFSKKN